MMDVGLEPTTPKTRGPAGDAICEGIRGVIVRVTTCKGYPIAYPY